MYCWYVVLCFDVLCDQCVQVVDQNKKKQTFIGWTIGDHTHQSYRLPNHGSNHHAPAALLLVFCVCLIESLIYRRKRKQITQSIAVRQHGVNKHAFHMAN